MNRQHAHINRDNYELWFIEHLEGRLSSTENEELQKFLLENADLGIELENLSEVTLKASASISFPDKATLKKASAPFSDLSAYNYQMVKAIEEDLPAPEQINLSTASAQADWHLYQRTKLQATIITYPHKSKLKRKRLAFAPAALKAVAAAIILLVLFNVKDDMPLQRHEERDLVAVTETTPTIEHTPLLTHPETTPGKPSKNSSVPDLKTTPQKSSNEEESVYKEREVNTKTLLVLPAPRLATLPTPRLPNSYETGLRLMLPKYVENHRLMASLSHQTMPVITEPEPQTLLGQTTDLIRKVTPFNLTYNKIYDEEGELVAINLSGDNFEVAQRIPKWWSDR